jgi:hypothetical protein
MEVPFSWASVVKVALPCVAFALAPACSKSSGPGGAQSSGNPESPAGDDAAAGDDASSDAADSAEAPTTLTYACSQSIAEWCCLYPGTVCWPSWTVATACLTPELSVTTMPRCGGTEAVRYDTDGGYFYTLYDAATGAFLAQGAEKDGQFGCFGGSTFTILAECFPTWDALPSAPCAANTGVVDASDGDAGGDDGGDDAGGDAASGAPPPEVGPSTYCDGGAWEP